MNGNGNGNGNENGIRLLTNNNNLRNRSSSSSVKHCIPSGSNSNSNSMISGKKYEAAFLSWSLKDVLGLAKNHSIPFVLGVSLFFFMGVEYTLFMIPPASPPFDLGFVLTRPIYRFLAAQHLLNSLLAALNTVFVGMQTTYILWTWLVEGRTRPTLAALFMFTCRGILGYSTQLPLPQEFLGSGADFPVGNVSFFLFFSGHVGGSVIASLDMTRMERKKMAGVFHALNVLQMVRLLGTRGHYTIDLAVGVGAALLSDSLAGKYLDCKNTPITHHPL